MGSCQTSRAVLHPSAAGGTEAWNRPRRWQAPVIVMNALHFKTEFKSQLSASSKPFTIRQFRMFTHSLYIKPTHSDVYQTKPIVLSSLKVKCQYSCLSDSAQQQPSACLIFTLFSDSTCKAFFSSSKQNQVKNSKSWNWTSYLAIKLVWTKPCC